MKNERNNKMISYCFLAALLSILPSLLSSQAVNQPFYNFKKFTTDDGLVSNNIMVTYKDTRGFLWIGTDRGLQRFNGSGFLTFRYLSRDSNSIANQVIITISEDTQHDIWIGTNEGVTKFNYGNGKFTNYRYGVRNNIKMRMGTACTFFEDSRGRLWIGTLTTGLYLFDKIKEQWINYPPAPGLNMKDDYFSRVPSVQETDKQEIILSVKDGFVLISKEGRQQHIQAPKATDKKSNFQPCHVLPLLKNYPDEIWLTAGFNGLFKYNRASKQWTQYLSGYKLVAERINAIINWNSNEWLLGYHNLCFFNHRTGIFTTAFDNKIINTVSAILHDNEDNFWIATSTSGLQLLNTSRQLFSSTRNLAGWGDDQILCYDKNSYILYSINPYVAANIHSLQTVTHTAGQHTIAYFAQNNRLLNNFIVDKDILYLAMIGGMWKFNLKTHQLDSIVYKNASFNSQQGTFFDVCKSAGYIYFAGRYGSGGPYQYNKTTHVVTDLALLTKKIEAPFHSYSLAFANDILYTGMTSGDSIYCFYESSGKRISIPIPGNYTNGTTPNIESMCIDKKQNLWCGTQDNGIYVFNIPLQKWLKHISQEDGYFAVSTSQIICDDDGVVWANSSEGLYAFNTTNFRFKNYTLKDALVNESSGGYLAVMANHQLAYNNIAGDNISFGIINTKPEDTTSKIIPISITGLQVLGKAFFTDTLLDNVNHIILPPNHNAFSLSYAGVNSAEGRNLLYTYLLDNAEKQWHDAGTGQSLSYINLNPGKYLLHIKCRSLNGQIISEDRLLHITLLPAWYQTWWFRLFAVLGFSGILFFAFRYYYIQQIRKHEMVLEKERALTEERNRIAADMHDDVGAGLSRIRYITSSMQSNNPANDKNINKIVSLSDEAVEKMNEIIWALNQGNQQLEELIYYSRSQCSQLLSNAGITFSFKIPETIPAKIIDWKDCRNIYLLIKEAVNNAIKHAEAGSVSIECSIDSELQLIVADNGKGFDPALVKEGRNGLLNYKKRVESLKGTYQIITSPLAGTRLIFTIPINPVS